jgi:hypothetical protein
LSKLAIAKDEILKSFEKSSKTLLDDTKSHLNQNFWSKTVDKDELYFKIDYDINDVKKIDYGKQLFNYLNDIDNKGQMDNNEIDVVFIESEPETFKDILFENKIFLETKGIK